MKTYDEMFSGQFPVKTRVVNDYVTFWNTRAESENILHKSSKKSPKEPEPTQSDNEHVKTEELEHPIPKEDENLTVITAPVSLEEHDIIAESEVQENGLVIYDEANLKEVKKGFLGRLVAKKRK